MKLNKTLIITSEFPPLPGGIGNHALHLAKNLQQNHKTVSVLTNQRSENIEDDISFDNSLDFKVVRVSLNKFTYLNRVLKAFSLAKENDIIITSGKFSLWLGGFLKLVFNKKTIAVLHGSEINAGGKWAKKLTVWSLKKHDKIIAVSNFTKQLMLSNCPDLKIEVINNGFENSEQKVKKFTPIIGNPSIITIGNVSYRKGQQNVIKALPLLQLKYPKIQYHIIGLPTEKHSFTLLAKELKVDLNISFHNAVDNDKKLIILSQSKVFFMLSDNLKNGDVEGFGIAVLEANALGIPAIGSLNTGIADAIADGFSGKLVNPHDAVEIAVAFDEIMNNYEQYSKNAVEWSKQFSWDLIIKKYINTIEK